jgi:tRNA-2-methylthio-N6-dimethylallyladenosine synthase
MSYQRVEISAGEVARQLEICEKIRLRNATLHRTPLAMVDTYGCQQNESDSEKLRGYLKAMGYDFTQDEYLADVVVINTCAVREHAEMRVLGNVGALNHTKKKNPNQIIAICGCMVQQPHMTQKLRQSFRLVDLVFGPHELWRFPQFLDQILTQKGRIFATDPSDGVLAEGLPHARDGKVKAWLSVMYGCNNFCSYCVVPYVRGRERSRMPEDILREARQLVEEGYKDITLLGQNVNSYGRDLEMDVDFSDLLEMVCAIPGEFTVRFMTSHPKDATEKLFQTMAACEKCAHHLHLPVQSGNDRVLKAMNRVYDREKYLHQVALARSYMPDLVLTTDIIVGFPGETDEEFEDTLRLAEEVRYDAMFTFIFSPRVGTPAAKLPDPATREEKQKRFDRLLEVANGISAEKHRAYVGKTLRVLVDGVSGDPRHPLSSRTDGGRLVHLLGGEDLIGRYVQARITNSTTWALFGEVVEDAAGTGGDTPTEG